MSEPHGLARLAGILYLLVLLAVSVPLSFVAMAREADVLALLDGAYVPRVVGVCAMRGGPFYAMAFFGPLFVADCPTSFVASAVGFVSGIPDLIGELRTALWLTVRGARARP